MATKKSTAAARVRELAAENKKVDTRAVRRALRAMEELGLTGSQYDVEGPYGERSLLTHCNEQPSGGGNRAN